MAQRAAERATYTLKLEDTQRAAGWLERRERNRMDPTGNWPGRTLDNLRGTV